MNEFENIERVDLNVNNNRLSKIPECSNRKKLKTVIINAEENRLENIDEFSIAFSKLEKIEKVVLKLNSNKLEYLPRFSKN